MTFLGAIFREICLKKQFKKQANLLRDAKRLQTAYRSLAAFRIQPKLDKKTPNVHLSFSDLVLAAAVSPLSPWEHILIGEV